MSQEGEEAPEGIDPVLTYVPSLWQYIFEHVFAPSVVTTVPFVAS
jgi:hypothetical protein